LSFKSADLPQVYDGEEMKTKDRPKTAPLSNISKDFTKSDWKKVLMVYFQLMKQRALTTTTTTIPK